MTHPLFAAYLAALDTYEAQIAHAWETHEREFNAGFYDPRDSPVARGAYEAVKDMPPQDARQAYRMATHGQRNAAEEQAFDDAFARELKLREESRSLWFEMAPVEEQIEAQQLAAYEARVCP